MTLRIVLPSTKRCTFGSVSAAFSIAASAADKPWLKRQPKFNNQADENKGKVSNLVNELKGKLARN